MAEGLCMRESQESLQKRNDQDNTDWRLDQKKHTQSQWTHGLNLLVQWQVSSITSLPALFPIVLVD